MEQKPEGIRCRARGSRATASIPDGKLSKQKHVFKFTEAISSREKAARAAEAKAYTHTDRHERARAHTHARAQASTDTTSRQA